VSKKNEGISGPALPISAALVEVLPAQRDSLESGRAPPRWGGRGSSTGARPEGSCQRDGCRRPCRPGRGIRWS